MNIEKQKIYRAAFDRCANPRDWKAPIDFITSKIYGVYPAALYCEAIEMFTATKATVQDLGNGSIRIRAAGYRNGPAA